MPREPPVTRTDFPSNAVTGSSEEGSTRGRGLATSPTLDESKARVGLPLPWSWRSRAAPAAPSAPPRRRGQDAPPGAPGSTRAPVPAAGKRSAAWPVRRARRPRLSSARASPRTLIAQPQGGRSTGRIWGDSASSTTSPKSPIVKTLRPSSVRTSANTDWDVVDVSVDEALVLPDPAPPPESQPATATARAVSTRQRRSIAALLGEDVELVGVVRQVPVFARAPVRVVTPS